MSFILIIMIEIHSREIPSWNFVTVGEIKSHLLYSVLVITTNQIFILSSSASSASLSCNEQSEYDISFFCISITYYEFKFDNCECNVLGCQYITTNKMFDP